MGERLGAAKEHRSGLISRQNLLKDMEAKREGVSEGVKSVLRQRDRKFPFIRGLVADVLRVDVEHAHVIEAALDGRDQLLVTHDSAAAMAARELLEDLEGRVNISVRRSPGRSPRTTTISTAIRTVFGWRLTWSASSRPIPLSPGNCWAARSSSTILPRALDLQNSGPRGYRYVTRCGEILEDGGVLRRPADRRHGPAFPPIGAGSPRAADRGCRFANRAARAGACRRQHAGAPWKKISARFATPSIKPTP